MTSTFAGATTAQRPRKLFLIPIGQENTHQRTIDGLPPADVVPSASTSALLPCWGVTDGNYLAKNKVRAQTGDIFALIRAQHKGQPAYVHRLAVVEKLVRDPSACAELYKVSHDYNMGGRKVTRVPFTWIIKFKAVVAVKWDKQALLAKLGIPAHDPILSARPAILAHQKNAAQAAQVLQECNAVLCSPSIAQQSLGSGPSPPATMLHSNSCGQHNHESEPLTGNGNSKTAHTPKPAAKRLHLELPDDKQIAQQRTALPLKRNKCMPSPASTDQHVNDQDHTLTDPQTDKGHDHGVHMKHHPEHAYHASSHHRPRGDKETQVVSSKHTELRHLSTEELQGKLGRLKQVHMNLLPDGGQLIMAECRLLENELEFRMAGGHSKHQGSTPDHSDWLGDPGSSMTTPAPAGTGCHGNSTVGLSSRGPQVPDVAMVEPQFETQPVSFAQAHSIQSELEEASPAFLKPAQTVSPPVQDSDHAHCIAAPAAIAYAQQSIIAGLIYHFSATKGPSWLAR